MEERVVIYLDQLRKRGRCDLATNPETDLSILTHLALDKDFEVRKGVAGNPRTSVDILQVLLKDGDEEVRAMAVRNKNLPIEDAVSAVRDPAWYVRDALVSREDCPKHILMVLKFDPVDFVTRKAKRLLKLDENENGEYEKENMNEKEI